LLKFLLWQISQLVDDFHAVPTTVLDKDEAYLDDLETFRRQHPGLFFEHHGGISGDLDQGEDPLLTARRNRTHAMLDELKELRGQFDPALAKEALERGQHVLVEGKYTGGYFRVNERYFPTKERNPFLEQAALDRVLDEDELDDERNPPVKISMPHRYIQATERKYVPHTRQTYDPGNAVSLTAYLHQGYAPMIRRKKQDKDQNVSFRRYVQQTQVQLAVMP
jgi:hypothetical protein